jgi:nanoRNase/pAp phosphatase (c-di-AMP/oligoRNAs hydrolase)
VANAINLPPETKFSLLLIECEPNFIKGSLRSESFKGVDVAMIARALGGGGHKYAAGFERSGETLENVLELVKKTARFAEV